MTFKEYITEIVGIRKPIKIVKKKWKTNYEDYKVEYNNLENHPLIPRIQSRTNLSVQDIASKFDKAIKYIIKKNNKGFFKRKSMVEFTFKKSEFKALILINPEENYIRFSTVLGMDMNSKGVLKWELNEEFLDIDFIEIDLDFDTYMTEKTSIKDVLKKEFPEIRFNLSENEEFLHLSIIVVQYNDRSKGEGTLFMKRLIELSKEVNKDIFITPDDSYSTSDGMNKKELIKWYKSLGFKNKEKSDFRSMNTMCYYSKIN